MSKKWLVDRMAGRPPKVYETRDYIGVFCLATLPAYFSLLAFGENVDRLEIPLLLAGVVAVALLWSISALDQRIWNKNRDTWERKLNERKPG